MFLVTLAPKGNGADRGLGVRLSRPCVEVQRSRSNAAVEFYNTLLPISLFG